MVGGSGGHRVDRRCATPTRTCPGAHHLPQQYRRRSSANAVNAALMCRDHMFGSLDDRSVRILKGLVSRRPKKELAAEEKISPSAVSQRAGRDGLDLIIAASQYLSEIT